MELTNNYNKAVAIPPLFILVLMVSVGPFGDTEYTPSLPSITRDLGVAYSTTQLTMTVYLFGYGISELFYGPLSDRYGRKPIMLIGAAIFIIGSVVCLTSYSIDQLLAGRLVQALGSCAGGVISSAAIRDAFPEDQRAKVFAKRDAAFALAPGLGPIVGSFVDHWFGWHINFLILVILAIILLISVWRFFPETNITPNKDALNYRSLFRNYYFILKDPYFLPYLIVVGLCIGVVYSCLIEAPALVVNILKLTSNWFAAVAGAIVFSFIAGSIVCSLLSNRVSDNLIIMAGLFTMLVGSLLLGLFAKLDNITFVTILFPIMIIFVGVALAVPPAMANALIPFKNITGSASAMMGFIQFVIAGLSTIGISALHDGATTAMPLTFSILSILAIIVFVGFVIARPGRERKTA
ncbi:multidrug effflux MFS transporter [Desulfobacterota bacterium AH_259_B03_O07]|nr:multidrug effflux MFS transporter [Desulfobacterota bacterium AH_259_B03_O07]